MNKINFSSGCLWSADDRKPLFSVVVAGDFCPRDPSAQERLKQGGAGEILASILPALQHGTFRLLQFETVLTEEDTPIDKSGPNLKSAHEAADFAVAGCFDAALLANNHTGDFGEAALLETIETLQRRKVVTVGAGRNPEDAAKVLYLEKNGFTLAVVNACEHEFGWSWGDHAGTNGIDMPVIRRSIAEAKSRANAVIVVLHGGNEYNPMPSPGLTRRLRDIADYGADAVVNIHPHCPQGVEIWNGVPIVYSPGNFYFPYPKEQDKMWYDGFLPEIGFDEHGAVSLSVTPYRFDNEAIRPLAAQAKQRFLEYLGEISSPIPDKRELAAWFEAWTSIFGPKWIGKFSTAPHELHPENLTREERKNLLALCNRLGCEAHNELMTAFFRQVIHAVVPDEKRIARIQELQNAKFR